MHAHAFSLSEQQQNQFIFFFLILKLEITCFRKNVLIAKMAKKSDKKSIKTFSGLIDVPLYPISYVKTLIQVI